MNKKNYFKNNQIWQKMEDISFNLDELNQSMEKLVPYSDSEEDEESYENPEGQAI